MKFGTVLTRPPALPFQGKKNLEGTFPGALPWAVLRWPFGPKSSNLSQPEVYRKFAIICVNLRFHAFGCGCAAVCPPCPPMSLLSRPAFGEGEPPHVVEHGPGVPRDDP